MVLENLVGPLEVDDELEGEVKEECEKYGTVETVKILPFEPNKVSANICLLLPHWCIRCSSVGMCFPSSAVHVDLCVVRSLVKS